MRLATLLLLCALRAMPCTCFGETRLFCRTPPDTSNPNAAIFLATVTSIENIYHADADERRKQFATASRETQAFMEPNLVRDRKIQLRIDERFIGTTEPVIHLMQGGNALSCCDCSIPFELGKQYLVFAGFHEGEWRTNVCSGTSLTQYATHQVASLRAWKQGRRESPAIHASVFALLPTNLGPKPEWSFQLRLDGPDGPREATITNGQVHSFRDLKPGVYKLFAHRPGWKLAHEQDSPRVINLTKAACAVPYLAMQPD